MSKSWMIRSRFGRVGLGAGLAAALAVSAVAQPGVPASKPAETAPASAPAAPGKAGKPGAGAGAASGSAKGKEARKAPAIRVQDVVIASNEIANRAACGSCKGAGTEVKQRQVGSRSVHTVMREKVYESYTAPCDTCEGVCVAAIEKVERPFLAFLSKLGQVDTGLPEWEAQRSRIEGNVRKMAAVGTGGWAKRLGESNRKFLGGSIKAGEPFVVHGKLVDDALVDGIRVLTVELNDATMIAMREPRIVDAMLDQPVILGGLFKGREGNRYLGKLGLVAQTRGAAASVSTPARKR